MNGSTSVPIFGVTVTGLELFCKRLDVTGFGYFVERLRRCGLRKSRNNLIP
eukprot:CAMPEP_0175896278 /NCGR_PEP_ID=MMETSP0108-20121206/79_1 /TAXON_ID=195067 ORGANISM="Goniomonas pacifica, Strain CCMP1869" /NCGR_SAMPLE_ID=MMETSP0108 /ASSEMBLY_ACC=CAM_ASM_000204 /LENGTH=50 /DNA_ID=CAMNT_0017217455 /DNA_START=636 /DNA_END=785 /DNA_ORIENTATION=-